MSPAISCCVPWRRVTSVALFTIGVLLVDACGLRNGGETSPSRTTRDFYAWYLTELFDHRNPMTDPSIRRYITEELVSSLNSRAPQAEPLNADYFLRVQDWPDDWRSHIEPVIVAHSSDSATVRLTLGDAASLRNTVVVRLRRGDDGWRIYSVGPVQ